jgi:hypothetical protein
MKEDKKDLNFDFVEYGNHVSGFLISISEALEDEILKEKAIDFSQHFSVSIDKIAKESTGDEQRTKSIAVERETRHFFKKAKELFKIFSLHPSENNGYYIAKNFEYKYRSKQARRTAGYCLNIFWSLLSLIIINFYQDFIAYFQLSRTDGGFSVQHFPLVTSDFNHILIILNTAFAITIIANVILLSYDKYKVNRIMHVITNMFFILAIANIIYFFPFALGLLPYGIIVPYLEDAIKILLAAVAVVLGIQVIVNFIRIIKKAKKSEELF